MEKRETTPHKLYDVPHFQFPIRNAKNKKKTLWTSNIHLNNLNSSYPISKKYKRYRRWRQRWSWRWCWRRRWRISTERSSESPNNHISYCPFLALTGKCRGQTAICLAQSECKQMRNERWSNWKSKYENEKVDYNNNNNLSIIPYVELKFDRSLSLFVWNPYSIFHSKISISKQHSFANSYLLIKQLADEIKFGMLTKVKKQTKFIYYFCSVMNNETTGRSLFHFRCAIIHVQELLLFHNAFSKLFI